MLTAKLRTAWTAWRDNLENRVPQRRAPKHRLFNLAMAAEIAETTPAALRTRTNRRLLNFIGPRPSRGVERIFPVCGIYEICMIELLEKHGLTQISASHVIRVLFETLILAAALPVPPEKPITEAALVKKLVQVEANPDLWLGSILGSRDLSRPQLAMFCLPDDYDDPLVSLIDGWEAVPREAVELQRRLKIRRDEHAFDEGCDPYALPDNHPDLQSGMPVIHFLNVTAALCDADKRIAQVSDAIGEDPL